MLSGSFIGTLKPRVSQLRHTSSGRELRRAGIELLSQSINETGWLKDSILVTTLVDNEQEGVINEANAMDIALRLVDGNHGVGVVRAIDEAAGTDSVVTVSVYRRLKSSLEDAIANSEMWVKTVLSYCLAHAA